MFSLATVKINDQMHLLSARLFKVLVQQEGVERVASVKERQDLSLQTQFLPLWYRMDARGTLLLD